MRRLSLLAALVLSTTACPADGDNSDDDGQDGADDSFVQPGLDDPQAREWEKAGGWYPEDRTELDDEVEALLGAVDVPDGPRAAVAVLTPHASLKFSGPTAAEVFARIEVPDTVIIVAPDHWGDGKPTSVWTEGPWLVPGHAIEIDYDLLGRVQEALPDLESDRTAFGQHESEMQLPFLQFVAPDVKIVPIAIFDNSRNDFAEFDPERIREWGAAIAEVMRTEQDAGRSVMIVATTDLVHHETLEVSDDHDSQLMEHIGALDIDGLYEFVNDQSVTICGEIPTAITMAALTELGYDAMDVVMRGSSLAANGDDTDVIGYPAAVTWKK